MQCDNCGKDFDPIATRWRCIHCGMKHPCCDGYPLDPVEHPGIVDKI